MDIKNLKYSFSVFMLATGITLMSSGCTHQPKIESEVVEETVLDLEEEKQLEEDNDFLMYITEKDKIVAALTGKNIDKKHKKITMGVLAVKKASYRKQGYAKKLIKEFETRCIKKGIKHIELGARFRACPLYINLGYKPFLMVQVYDFITTNEIRKANTFQLEEKSSYQSDTYGFIIFKVDNVKKEYVDHFEKNIKTSYAEYIFEKNL